MWDLAGIWPPSMDVSRTLRPGYGPCPAFLSPVAFDPGTPRGSVVSSYRAGCPLPELSCEGFLPFHRPSLMGARVGSSLKGSEGLCEERPGHYVLRLQGV